MSAADIHEAQHLGEGQWVTGCLRCDDGYARWSQRYRKAHPPTDLDQIANALAVIDVTPTDANVAAFMAELSAQGWAVVPLIAGNAKDAAP